MTVRPALPRRRLGAAALTATMLATALAACTERPPSDEELTTAARAAAEQYVAAIAAQDQEAADAMTEPTELEVPDVDEMVDVRAALGEAAEPISDTWLRLLAQDPSGTSTYARFQVSYLIGDVVGADTIELVHHRDDPVEAWTVIDGLLVSGGAFADEDTVPTFTFGGVPLENEPTSNVNVWGYPGAYLTEATETAGDVAVEPVTVVLGAETVPPWNDSLPMLEAVSAEG